MKKGERLVALTHYLINNPGQQVSLLEFQDQIGGAKSTLSEDLGLIRKVFTQLDLGEIKTTKGAKGGVIYLPDMSFATKSKFLRELCQKLSNPDRILSGNFLLMADILTSPNYTWRIAQLFAAKFFKYEPQFIVTIETKGIPVAAMTAKIMGRPLLIIRKKSLATEGPCVSISYQTGSQKSLGTMALPRKALSPQTKVLLIDDFMKAGGTAQGMLDLMGEFSALCVGLAVVVATKEPVKKMIDHYYALLTLDTVDKREKKVIIEPNQDFDK